MSAFLPLATELRTSLEVRLVPTGDIAIKKQKNRLAAVSPKSDQM
jgi:hypothetical protein